MTIGPDGRGMRPTGGTLSFSCCSNSSTADANAHLRRDWGRGITDVRSWKRPHLNGLALCKAPAARLLRKHASTKLTASTNRGMHLDGVPNGRSTILRDRLSYST